MSTGVPRRSREPPHRNTRLAQPHREGGVLRRPAAARDFRPMAPTGRTSGRQAGSGSWAPRPPVPEPTTGSARHGCRVLRQGSDRSTAGADPVAARSGAAWPGRLAIRAIAARCRRRGAPSRPLGHHRTQPARCRSAGGRDGRRRRSPAGAGPAAAAAGRCPSALRSRRSISRSSRNCRDSAGQRRPRHLPRHWPSRGQGRRRSRRPWIPPPDSRRGSGRPARRPGAPP